MSKGPAEDALRTPRQIRSADLNRLRKDERLWTAYERGWCDFLQMYMDSKLMQGETDYIILQSTNQNDCNNSAQTGDSAAADRTGRITKTVAQDSSPLSADVQNSPSPSTVDVVACPAPTPSTTDAIIAGPASSPTVDDSSPPIHTVLDEESPSATDNRQHNEQCLETSLSESDDDDDKSGCYDASESNGDSDTSAEEYTSDNSTRDADSEVRRVMFGDESSSSSETEPEAMSPFSIDDLSTDSVSSAE